MNRRIIHIDAKACNGCGLCAEACHEGAIRMIEGKAVLTREDYCDGLGDCLPSCPTGAITFEEREAAAPAPSRLSQWPIQIKLAPVNAPYFTDADLLIAADCTAFSCGNFHQDFIRNHITLIGCPKLDSVDYSEKLTEILRKNTIRSITVTRMEVPCCGGIQYAAKRAIADSGKTIPLKVVTIGIGGMSN